MMMTPLPAAAAWGCEPVVTVSACGAGASRRASEMGEPGRLRPDSMDIKPRMITTRADGAGEVFLRAGSQAGGHVSQGEKDRAGAEGEGSHDRCTLQGVAGGYGDRHHGLGHPAGDQHGHGAQEQGSDQGGAVLGFTADAAGEGGGSWLTTRLLRPGSSIHRWLSPR